MRPTELFDCVVIVGVGLIGGSIGLGIRQRFLANHVIGLDQNPKSLEAALGMGVIDEAKFNAGKWLEKADLVILASPAATIVSSAESLQPFLRPDALITDVGSAKAAIVESLQASGLRFVGSHPMAGSEKGGVQNASAALLENAMWVLTPNEQTDKEALDKIRDFVIRLGAHVVEIDPEKHDRLVAFVSHLPYISAVTLTQLIAQDADYEEMALLAAGGFRDVSRVASGSPRMSRDMVMENKVQLKAAIAEFREQLAVVESLLDEPAELLEFAEKAKYTRDSIPIVKRNLLPSTFELNVAVPDKPGQLALITQALGDAEINIRDIEILDIRELGGALRLNFNHEEGVTQATVILNELGFETRRTG